MSPSYEDKRLENIRKNKALLAELQLGQLAAIASVHPSSTVQKKKHPSASSTTSTNPPFKRKKTLPVRSSLRLKGLQPDATASTLKSTTNPLSPTPALIPPKLKPDHFVANDAYLGGNLHILTTWESSSNGSLETTKENSLEENKKGEEEKEKEKQTKEVISWFSSFHAPSKPFPVTPTRVYSTIFAPLATKSIACVGDKVGSLSIWDITDYLSDPFSDQTPSVCTFQPHTGALSQLHFLEPHALSTLSFDGTLRVFDLNQQTFSTLFSTHGQETLHAFDPSEQTLWIGTGTGHVLQLDPRSKSLVHRLTHVHEKKCGCLMVHPQHSYWVLSSSNDRFIKLLDTRTLRVVDEYFHPRSCTSGYFNPNGSAIVSTSYDNAIRIWKQPSLLTSSTPTDPMSGPSFSTSSLTTLSHGTQTGKWVTPFRAKWHPTFTDTLFVGSLSRCVDIYHATTGKRVCSLSSSTMTAVPAVIGFHADHPNMFITGNASGKCHIFMKETT